jgi:hypothetical protein
MVFDSIDRKTQSPTTWLSSVPCCVREILYVSISLWRVASPETLAWKNGVQLPRAQNVHSAGPGMGLQPAWKKGLHFDNKCAVVFGDPAGLAPMSEI